MLDDTIDRLAIKPLRSDPLEPFTSVNATRRVFVAYYRRSDPNQGDNHSLEIQKSVVEIAKTVYGADEVVEFTDDQVSAYRFRAGEREEIISLREYVLSHPEVVGVIFYDLSRLSRQGGGDVYYDLVRPILDERPEVQFISARDMQIVNFRDPMTQFQFVLAKNESDKKSRYAIDYQNKELGKKSRPSLPAPYGMEKTMGGVGLRPNNETAPIVSLIFHLAYWGYSDETIADILNDALISSPRGEKPWGPSTIDSIINNRVYCGDLSWGHKQRVQGKVQPREAPLTTLFGIFEPVIPPYLWEGVHVLRAIKSKQKKLTATSNFLLGIIAYSGNSWTVIPESLDHPFRKLSITVSDNSWTGILKSLGQALA